MTVRPVDLEKIAPKAEGIYEAIIIAAKRARQLNQELRIELNQQLETLAQLTTTVDSDDEIDTSANPDQLRISLEFEQRPKPAEVALKELSAHRLEWRYKEVEAPKTEEEQEPEEEKE